MFCILEDLFGVDSRTANYIIGMAKYGYSVNELDQSYGRVALPLPKSFSETADKP